MFDEIAANDYDELDYPSPELPTKILTASFT